ncbi:DNA repair RAD52-like protein 2, chloroplastic [Gastrolobium bilobum]|uniref:DNA repair RAD52-like protein 2, chloroplastic n=1 Tax=Gastrolobium bilobum TaxID=150636 RepID=UPI002AAFAE28|nr:DNA repair RAD52-like protein 2, chloroplastic [Gastrolobium bilobum]
MAFVVRPNTNPFVSKMILLSSYNQSRKEGLEVGFVRKKNFGVTDRLGTLSVKCALERGSNSSDGKKGGVSNSNYVVPLDNSSCITRPLAEILRDLNKRIPDTIVRAPIPGDSSAVTFIPWYHANRMLSFYAPGWCGEIRDVIFSDNGSVTVVYRLTVRGSDGEAYRESTGTISPSDGTIGDPVSAAEEIAFCKACARFGLGLYLYHEDQMNTI